MLAAAFTDPAHVHHNKTKNKLTGAIDAIRVFFIFDSLTFIKLTLLLKEYILFF
ncbi:hypothetical protein CLAVI_000542 [Candidatus Clavichlamydia salmonicola]|nr:hypothetical protein [Candidatus Clavichlamydia salmonicola]